MFWMDAVMNWMWKLQLAFNAKDTLLLFHTDPASGATLYVSMYVYYISQSENRNRKEIFFSVWKKGWMSHCEICIEHWIYS